MFPYLLPLITLPMNKFHTLMNKSSRHARGTCYSLFLLPPSFHCSPWLAGTAISCTADVRMTRLILLCCTIGKNVSSFPGLSSLGETRPRKTFLGPRDGQHCQRSSPFKFYSQPFYPQDAKIKTWAGNNLTDKLRPLPWRDHSFLSGSSLSIRTNPHQKSHGTMS